MKSRPFGRPDDSQPMGVARGLSRSPRLAPELIPARRVPLWQMVKLFNEAYSEYYVPVSLSLERLASLVHREDIDLERSRVAAIGGRLVGLGLLGLRSREAYICGVGVVPDLRGMGIGRAVMESLLQEARQAGAGRVRLEVLCQNERAVRLYSGLGFAILGELTSYSRDLGGDAAAAFRGRSPLRPCTAGFSMSGEPYVSRSVDPAVLISTYLLRFHTVEPSWQEGPDSILKVADRLLAVAWYRKAKDRVSDDPSGYVLYRTVGDRLYIADFGSDPQHEPARFSERMLGLVQGMSGASKAIIYNVQTRDYHAQTLAALGYEEDFRQYEMELVFRRDDWRYEGFEKDRGCLEEDRRRNE